MQEYAEKFYKSTAWKKCRKAFINSLADKTCNRCHKLPGKIVHHKEAITPENINNPFITLSFSNLEYICQDCHNKEHMSSMPVKENLMFDNEGNLVKRKDKSNK